MKKIDRLLQAITDLKKNDYLPTFIEVLSNEEYCYSNTRVFDEYEKLIPTFKGSDFDEVYNQIKAFMKEDDYFKVRVDYMSKKGCKYPYIVFDLT